MRDIILALDPSLTATGWVVYKDGKIRTCGARKIKSDVKNKTRLKIDRQETYAEFITSLVRGFNITQIATEFPHGAKSFDASWCLSMVTAVITTVAHIHEIPVEYYLESQAKKALLGRAKNVQKYEIRKKTLDIFGKIGYIEPTAIYKAEAIADALAILNLYLLDKKRT